VATPSRFAFLTHVFDTVGDSVSVAPEPMALWPEPKVTADLAEAFASDPQARRLWMDITPLARWDWIRRIGATRNRDTRAIRMEKTLSKLRSRKRGLVLQPQSMHRPLDVAQRRASRTNAR
jgi:uncharacterized protein YdeI (YjbR/CyaY-like superfamily)